MTKEQIKHMVDRFLGWRLPENFSPDAGISFKRDWRHYAPYSMPTGTNLFGAGQADAMVRYMIEGMPTGCCIDLSDKESAVLAALAKEKDMSETAILRQALRHYQLVNERMNAGETFSFSGDAGRAAEFAGGVVTE